VSANKRWRNSKDRKINHTIICNANSFSSQLANLARRSFRISKSPHTPISANNPVAWDFGVTVRGQHISHRAPRARVPNSRGNITVRDHASLWDASRHAKDFFG